MSKKGAAAAAGVRAVPCVCAHCALRPARLCLCLLPCCCVCGARGDVRAACAPGAGRDGEGAKQCVDRTHTAAPRIASPPFPRLLLMPAASAACG